MTEEDTHRIVIRIPEEEIIFVDMVLKSYEGLAMLTIDHDRKGIVNLDVTEGTRERVLDILQDFNRQFPVEILKK